MDDMGHVRVLGLGRGTVCGHVEVAGDLGREARARRSVGCLPLELDTFGFGPRSVRPRDSEEPQPPSEPQVPRLQTAAVTELPEGLLGAGGSACPLGTWHKAAAPITTTSLAVGSTGDDLRLTAQGASSNSLGGGSVASLAITPVSNTVALSGTAPSSLGPALWADTGGTRPTGRGLASASSQWSG